MSLPDRLIAADLEGSLSGGIIGRRVLVLESTASTNDFLRQMLTPELPEGFVIFAEEQTAGRGQRGNRWASASHLGLWFSILLRPQIPMTESACLTNWAAQAIAETIQTETNLVPMIKLPNDVLIDERKVAGVLVETKAGLARQWTAIVGIGVNVNQAPGEFPEELRERAGSLGMAFGRPIDRSGFAVALLRELERTRMFTMTGPKPSQPLSS